jgi:hypothetical protein
VLVHSRRRASAPSLDGLRVVPATANIPTGRAIPLMGRAPPNNSLVRPVHPKPCETRGMGGEGRNNRQVLNFDNCVSIQVRWGNPPTPDLQAEE